MTHHVYAAWWRHQVETYFALLSLCAGNSPVTGEFPSQRPVTLSFDVFCICAGTNGSVHNRDASYLRRHRAHCDVNVTRIDPHCCSDQQEMNMISSITGPLWGNSSKLLMDFPNKWAVMRQVFQFYDDLILNKLNLNHRNTEARSCSWDLLTWINRNE